MLTCFDGLVGLAHACNNEYAASPTVPLESFGIDETMIAQFTGSEDTVASIIRDAEQRARAIMQKDVLSYYAPRIIPHTFLRSQRAGEPDGMQTLVSDGEGLNGILVEVRQLRTNVRITLSGLRFYAAATEDVEFNVYDLNDGSIVGTFMLSATQDAISTSSDVVTIELQRSSGSFFIAHALSTWRVQRIGSGCASCKGGKMSHGGVTISGASLGASSGMIRSNLRIKPATGGMSINVDVACDHGQFLCEGVSLWATPYATKVAELIMRRGIYAVERINSQRINLELLRERADGAAEEYAGSMSNLLGRVVVNGDDVCLSCVRYTRVVTSAP